MGYHACVLLPFLAAGLAQGARRLQAVGTGTDDEVVTTFIVRADSTFVVEAGAMVDIGSRGLEGGEEEADACPAMETTTYVPTITIGGDEYSVCKTPSLPGGTLRFSYSDYDENVEYTNDAVTAQRFCAAKGEDVALEYAVAIVPTSESCARPAAVPTMSAHALIQNTTWEIDDNGVQTFHSITCGSSASVHQVDVQEANSTAWSTAWARPLPAGCEQQEPSTSWYIHDETPEPSCAAILAQHPESTDGTYWVQPNRTQVPDAAPVRVQCDMTQDGGGWTLVMHVVNDTAFRSFDYLASADEQSDAWHTRDAFNPDACENAAVNQTCKLGDATINALRAVHAGPSQAEYRVQQPGATNMNETYFFPGACVYNHVEETQPFDIDFPLEPEPCAACHWDESLTQGLVGTREPSAQASAYRGMFCRLEKFESPNLPQFSTNFLPYGSIGGPIVDNTASGGGFGTPAPLDLEMMMWVR